VRNRLEQRLDALYAIGAQPDGGAYRGLYDDAWAEAMDLVERWFNHAGLKTRRDAVGNLWGRVEGSNKEKSVVTGSHIDTVRRGGRLDGALGIVAGLTAVEALLSEQGQPKRTLEVVAICEEEGSRFSTNFWGSRAIIGELDRAPDDIAAAMRSRGLDPARLSSAARDDIDTFIELHIEQGPVLQAAGLPVAIVDAITGIRHVEVTLTGEQNHAGAFPMDLRRDPMAGFAEIASTLIDHAHRLGRPAVTTIGRVSVDPNGPAIVPRSVTFNVDARHPDPEARKTMYAVHDAVLRELSERRRLQLDMRLQMSHEPCLSDPHLLGVMRAAAAELSIPHLVMASGAGHDSQQMAAIAPVAMIFIRSKDGRSHTPEEFSSTEDIVKGIELLAETLYRLAY